MPARFMPRSQRSRSITRSRGTTETSNSGLAPAHFDRLYQAEFDQPFNQRRVNTRARGESFQCQMLLASLSKAISYRRGFISSIPSSARAH